MEMKIVILNLLYAMGGTVIALLFMVLGYKVFDLMTPFNTSEEIKKGNIAVGIVIGAIFISLGISVGAVIGLGLN